MSFLDAFSAEFVLIKESHVEQQAWLSNSVQAVDSLGIG